MALSCSFAGRIVNWDRCRVVVGTCTTRWLSTAVAPGRSTVATAAAVSSRRNCNPFNVLYVVC